jgi:hypothetical protein
MEPQTDPQHALYMIAERLGPLRDITQRLANIDESLRFLLTHLERLTKAVRRPERVPQPLADPVDALITHAKEQ